ncbi:ATP-dependent transcriptional regulator, MalT-like, LuxR family [Pseudonocardia dioxanivorans CB1190]|uniref:ATP-dependent transcriptional regulator, MalT-like, LuxR family n=1 Tax=Pseudonocardia dioxanivorans (strain ATCC 55486 / DSM 44775 / JCM 13855 / CB1190) TaxID=675635 RepID=F4CW05_PSEUX|nr:LuxR C-terminal-related transcriptional regulator [Pseudonocardia dioxanivorans]AEA26419.1 ATP-dependent transcriptional regulator, MalT-like, LuxR family [Pseudonocardia dioxanivorans CB1190]GJF03098.1 LuxR family transcriptional regulator [Pseudonocardia sp. D17]
MSDAFPPSPVPPPLPRELVPRPALRAALDEGAGRAVTLVCAPAGFGKSVAVADWVRRGDTTPSVWLSLTEEHDDPVRLWTAVLTAVRARGADPAAAPSDGRAPGIAGLGDVLAEFATLPGPLRLVLDDAHHLRGRTCAEQLREFVRAHGPAVQLVVVSRLDPPLPLARMRLAGELCELRADRLRFGERETATLLRRCGLELTAEQASRLHERTGGWVAGLRLAACSMRQERDPDRFLADFSGDDHAVADYLVGEVLAGISEDRREVLRRVSIADPVPAGLAVELCDRDDAADVLDELGHELGLVNVDPDRADYHVQELLRSHLEADLARRDGASTADLHRRAALWWDGHGRPAEALRHAGKAGDPTFAGGMLERRGARLVAIGDRAALRDALRAAGTTAEARTWAAALSAQENLVRGDMNAVAADVRRARRDGRPAAGSELAVLLTATSRLAGLSGSVPATPEPLPDDPSLAALALAGRGAVEVFAGAPGPGRSNLATALDTARRRHLPLLEAQCLALLGVAAWNVGDLREAAARSDGALRALTREGWEHSGLWVTASSIAALTAVERGRPDVALVLLEGAAGPDPDSLDPAVRVALGLARGAALFDSGERAAGVLELQRARSDGVGQPLPPALATTAALIENRIALRMGYTRAAAAAEGRIEGLTGARGERLLMRAWAECETGEYRKAYRCAHAALDPASRSVRRSTLVEAWLVLADVALHDGDRPGARCALRSALDRAAAMDLARPFVMAPSAVRALLVDELMGDGDRGRFAARVLSVPTGGPRGVAPTLTAREEDVLALLPSLLNLDEIAAALSVSVNTVKSHVRSIYDKLGVCSRRRAVLAAHERGLLGRRPSATRTGTPHLTVNG